MALQQRPLVDSTIELTWTMAPSTESQQPVAVITLPFFIVCMVMPYLLGLFISSQNLAVFQDILEPILSITQQPVKPRRASVPLKDLDNCYKKLVVKMHRGRDEKHRDDPFADLNLVVHRNGQAEACGDSAGVDIMQELKNTLQDMNECPTDFGDKYQVEALMTRLLQRLVSEHCPSQDSRSADLGFMGYCDMGESRTPILPDHGQLVSVKDAANDDIPYLPCHFHTQQGVRVTSLTLLAQLARHSTVRNDTQVCAEDVEQETCVAPDAIKKGPRELHLYAIPAGRNFMFSPSYIGEIISLPHVSGGDPTKPVYLEVLSVSPRVFDLVNFFSKAESAELVERALKETSESHRIKQSTTGAVGNHKNNKRTSESGFDTSGKTAIRIKRRCFDTLGFDEYLEEFSDGLQILRYNLTTAYIPHMDWIEEKTNLVEHDYESAFKGGNRFGTILLYMSDLGPDDGGETVFEEAWPVGVAEEDRVSTTAALRQLRESEQGMVLEKNSWQEKMVAKCRSRLAIRPNSARSVLFYSQHPNGEEDKASLHGGCPVLVGDKWAANLWVWNTPRHGYPNNPKNPKFKRKGKTKSKKPTTETSTAFKAITVTFTNSGTDPLYGNAELYFENKFWGKLGPSDPPISMTSYKSHVWNVRVDGKLVHSWTIESDEDEQQDFTI